MREIAWAALFALASFSGCMTDTSDAGHEAEHTPHPIGPLRATDCRETLIFWRVPDEAVQPHLPDGYRTVPAWIGYSIFFPPTPAGAPPLPSESKDESLVSVALYECTIQGSERGFIGGVLTTVVNESAPDYGPHSYVLEPWPTRGDVRNLYDDMEIDYLATETEISVSDASVVVHSQMGDEELLHLEINPIQQNEWTYNPASYSYWSGRDGSAVSNIHTLNDDTVNDHVGILSSCRISDATILYEIVGEATCLVHHDVAVTWAPFSWTDNWVRGHLNADDALEVAGETAAGLVSSPMVDYR